MPQTQVGGLKLIAQMIYNHDLISNSMHGALPPHPTPGTPPQGLPASPIPSPPVPAPPLAVGPAPVGPPPTTAPPPGVAIVGVNPYDFHDGDLIDMADEHPAVTWIGRHFYGAGGFKAFLIGVVVFTIIPALLSLVTAMIGGVTTMDDGIGFYEDYAGWSFFSLGLLLPILTKRMMGKLPFTIESLSNVVILDEDNKNSTMSKKRLDNLIDMYSYLYCKETGRDLKHLKPPTEPDLLKFTERMLFVKKIVIVLTVLYPLLTALNRFVGVEGGHGTDPWHFWDSSEVAWIGSTIAQIMIGSVMGSLVLYPVFLSVMITFHSLKEVSDSNSLRFMRFSKDEAGGLGSFGVQSFSNTIALLPFSFVLIGIIAQAKHLGATLAITTMLATGIYAMLLIFVFLFPLAGASRSMGRLKKTELEILAEYYATSYDHFKIALNDDNLDDIRISSEAMIAADEVFQGVLKQPTVPYSPTLIARLLALTSPVFGLLTWLFVG